MSAHDDASHESARTIDEALGAAPALLDSAAGRRQQAEIRARLFDTPIAPEHIGRFEVIRRLGAGAGGVVYLARDARLHREVAIKVMRGHVTDAARLRREAMTMARLSHPNVATVFEIGTHEGRVYLVMELVQGVTLRVWQAARRWPEIVDAYLQAGAGLAAAHRAGVVHRDFKPDNVMISNEARVCVLDFGLARGEELEPHVASTLDREPATLATTLTGSGTTLGTPAYMPPEQLRSAAVDARADQFAFCVALFEACFGARPFAGDTVREIYEAIEGGRIRAPPRDRRLPRGLRQAIERGLAADPEARWPDLDALLVALVRARRRPRRRLALAGGAIAFALLGVVALHDRDACATATQALDDAWSTTRADRLRARVRAERDDGQPWRTRIEELERGAEAWRAEAIALCHGTAPEAALRRSCLDDVRTAIANGGDGLEAALDRGAASPDARGVLSTSECVGLRERGMLPDLAAHDELADVAAIRAAITATIAAGDRGDYAAAAAAIEPAVARARAIDAPALLAEALLLQAATAGYRGELAIAAQQIGEAFEIARAAGADRLALRAATDALDVVGHAQRRREDGERWAREGEAFAARLPSRTRRACASSSTVGSCA
ncbi:MAG TPA: serine/threonine-protein kinase [Nannocystaceae bacterium]|nr:serine/threonine-protein kinase [Nannocystaceae bacterium]